MIPCLCRRHVNHQLYGTWVHASKWLKAVNIRKGEELRKILQRNVNCELLPTLNPPSYYNSKGKVGQNKATEGKEHRSLRWLRCERLHWRARGWRCCPALGDNLLKLLSSTTLMPDRREASGVDKIRKERISS